MTESIYIMKSRCPSLWRCSEFIVTVDAVLLEEVKICIANQKNK